METVTGIEITEKSKAKGEHEAYQALRETLSREHTLSLHPESLPGITLPEQLSVESVQLDAKRLQLRGESGHHVFSCDLVFPQENGENVTIPCLAKRHEKPRKGETEFRNTQRVIAKGVRTIDPVAFVGSEERSFVFLKFEPALRSADTVRWDTFSEPVRQSESAAFLEKAAESLAQLHAKGIFHHDTYLRNISFQKDDASVYFFDWEKAHIYTQSKAFEHEGEFVPKAGSDLGRLFESCCREGLVVEQPIGAAILDQYEQLVLEPYKRSLHHYNPNIAGSDTLGAYARSTFVVPPPKPLSV